MIYLIDNYDSFAHNLARYLRQLRQEVVVIRNDEMKVAAIERLKPQAIIMSPGPCTPNEAGICLDLVQQLGDTIPMLGVCLGHQAICQAFGGSIVRVPPVHGRSSELTHTNHALFKNISSPFIAARYHSLVVDPQTVPEPLDVIAHSPDGIVMAVAHRQLPIFGFQFHPESILTDCGYQLLSNFLSLASIPVSDQIVKQLSSQLQSEFTS